MRYGVVVEQFKPDGKLTTSCSMFPFKWLADLYARYKVCESGVFDVRIFYTK